MKQKVIVIAEAGVNHNGSLKNALDMVRVAKDSGANFIKFQTFFADSLATKKTPLARYQEKTSKSATTQWELLRNLELSTEEFQTIREYCKELDIGFMSTAFGIKEFRFLVDDLGIPVIKIASGDLTFAELLYEAGLSGLPILLSTGMATLEEIEEALKFIAVGIGVNLGVYTPSTLPTEQIRSNALGLPVINIKLFETVTLLHCTSKYPASPISLNLNFLTTLSEKFGLSVGYSDHSLGIEASLVAVALGASIIEKHFTLDKSLDGPDHASSLTPSELKGLVRSIRLVESMLGEQNKNMDTEELSNKKLVRRSLVVTSPIRAGEQITAEKISALRPAEGLSAFKYFDLLGTRAKMDFKVGDYYE